MDIKKIFKTFVGGFIFIIIVICCIIPTGGSTDNPTENVAVNSERGCSMALYSFENYLKDNMREPSSFEVITHDCVYNNERECYVADVEYRAKNGFGGYSIERVMCDITVNDGTYNFGEIVLLYRK